MATKITKAQPTTKTAPVAKQVTNEDAAAVEKSLALLARDDGATIDDLMAETGLTNPQVRTLLSRLRRLGHEVINIGRCQFRVPAKAQPEQKQSKPAKKTGKPKGGKVEKVTNGDRQTVTKPV